MGIVQQNSYASYRPVGPIERGNWGQGRYSAKGQVENSIYTMGFAISSRSLARGDRPGGNLAAQLGDILIGRGLAERDGTSLRSLRPAARLSSGQEGGPFNRMIHLLARRLHDANLKPNFILRQPGIGDSGAIDFGGSYDLPEESLGGLSELL